MRRIWVLASPKVSSGFRNGSRNRACKESTGHPRCLGGEGDDFEGTQGGPRHPRRPTSWGAGRASPGRPGPGSRGSAPCSARLLLRGVPGYRPIGGGRCGAGSPALGAQPSQAWGTAAPGPRPGVSDGFPRDPPEPSR